MKQKEMWLRDWNEGRNLVCKKCGHKKVCFYEDYTHMEGGKIYKILNLFCLCGAYMGSDKTEIKRFEK